MLSVVDLRGFAGFPLEGWRLRDSRGGFGDEGVESEETKPLLVSRSSFVVDAWMPDLSSEPRIEVCLATNGGIEVFSAARAAPRYPCYSAVGRFTTAKRQRIEASVQARKMSELCLLVLMLVGE